MGIIKKTRTLIRKIFFGGSVAQPKPAVRVPSETEVPLQTYVDLFGEEAVRERRFYNVGGGTQFVHPAWTVINHPSEHYGKDYMDLQWDLMSHKPMPIESGKAKVIFSRYTLEHVPDQAVAHFLADAHRALAPGGYLRIIVPDIDLYCAAYRMRDSAFFHRPKQDRETYPTRKYLSNPNQASFEQRFLWNFASSASILHPDPAAQPISDLEFRKAFETMSYEQALEYCTARASMEVQRRYPENHINWFNSAKMERIIRTAGFQNVYRSGYGQSHCALLRDVKLLEARQPEVGLFFEAVK